jgi:hypothetical protein
VTSVTRAHQILLARVKDRAASLRPEFPRFELLRLLAFSAQRTGIRGAGMSARESETLVNFGPALARRLPANTLRPKTARRAGHLRAPSGIERAATAMSSTATGTRSRWFPLPHKRISVGAEALMILLWAACLVSRRGAVDR